jgi:hypothetical protein
MSILINTTYTSFFPIIIRYNCHCSTPAAAPPARRSPPAVPPHRVRRAPRRAGRSWEASACRRWRAGDDWRQLTAVRVRVRVLLRMLVLVLEHECTSACVCARVDDDCQVRLGALRWVSTDGGVNRAAVCG